MQPTQIAPTLVAGTSDRLSIDEFGRLVRANYHCKFIFLGNLSIEQTLGLRIYKNTYSRLSQRGDPESQKFYRKFLLLPGDQEYRTLQRIDAIADARYREILTMMFKHSRSPSGEAGTGTRIHVRQLDITFMHGFYGSSKQDSDHYVMNRLADDTIEHAFRRLAARAKHRVICGHNEHPVAYVQSPNRNITTLSGEVLGALTLDTQSRYIIDPGALNLGYYLLINKSPRGTISIEFKRLPQATGP